MRYGRYLAGLLVLGIALLFSIQSEAAAKKTIYNSPYVSFSPDGRAFTTCAGHLPLPGTDLRRGIRL